MLGHDLDQLLVSSGLRVPAQNGLGLGGVAPQIVHIGGTEPLRIHTDQHLAGGNIVALLINAGALALVDEAEKVLVNKERDLDDFGRMLDHTWKLKRQTGSAVSTNSIDELYAKGIAAGALGGKLLGAGGGGFLVFYVQPERQDAVRWAMRDLLYIPFQFEDGGTRVIHYTPEDYVPKD